MGAPLILVRHGTSTANKLGIWTGHDDPELAEEGVEEAKSVGKLLHDLPIHHAFTSDLKRAKDTLGHILTVLGKEVPTVIHEAIKERHYGIHTGKNKWEVREAVGEEEFQKIRRSWDHPIPEGESLKQVFERVVPFFEEHIRPHLRSGKGVIVAAHGNSLRALVKHLEKIAHDEISKFEFLWDEAHVYHFEGDDILRKEVRRVKK